MVKLTERELKEKEKYFYDYMSSGNNASLSEVDANANVSSKSVATFGAENNKDINVQVNKYILGKRIEKLFGSDLKDSFFKDMEDGYIYLHDASSNSGGTPYCVAIDSYPFIMNGDIPLGGNSKAPKHLASYIGAYVNLIFLIAGQFAGAVADVSLLLYFDYFARKDYGDNYLETHTELIKNCLQQLVYTINAPSGGRGQQSIFYNTSIFDENYFKSLFSEMVLPDFTNPDWESVNKLQKFFMSWFNKERTKALLTFPVITFAGQTENGKFKDQDFKDFMTKEMSEGNSFFIYSSDSVDSLSSCCFHPNTLVNILDDSQTPRTLRFNELEVLLKEKIIENYLIYSKGLWKKGKLVKLDSSNYTDMYRIETKFHYGSDVTTSYLDTTNNHRHNTDRGVVITSDLKVGDKLSFYYDETLCSINENNPTLETWTEIISISKIDYKDNVYCFEMEDKNDDNFTLASGVHTKNCRLRNEISTDDKTFAYTLGGTGLATGSKKVITLNINRITQHKIDLLELVGRVHKYLVSFDDILYEEQSKGLLPVYDEGYISLDKQYLTLGVNGLIEGAEYLGFEISDNKKYKSWLKDILSSIMKSNREANTLYSEKFGRKTMFNTELVPAESLGVKFAKKDKEDGLKVNRDCYNSYFYRVEDDLDIFDKLDMYSKDVLDSLDGGSAVHLNLQEIPNQGTWEKIVDHATKVGCNYWTYNVKSTCCEEKQCGYINKETKDHCTKCGSKNITHATRIIGYLKKITSFSNDRQIEEGLRKYK